MRNTPGNSRKSFTVLELIIVIIIVSVLASLALPRMMMVVERARATEAIINIQSIRQAMERCILMRGGNYGAIQSCTGRVGLPPWPAPWPIIALDDPTQSPNSHFDYAIAPSPVPVPFYIIAATRNTRELSIPEPGGSVNFTIGGSAASLSCSSKSGIILVATDTEVQMYSCGFYK